MNVLTAPLLGDSILNDQIILETEAVAAGVRRYRHLAAQAVGRGDGASLKPAERLLLHWLDPLVEAIRVDQRGIRRGEPDVGRGVHGPALLLLDPERLAVITVHEALGACMAEPSGVVFTAIAYATGRAVFAEASLDILTRDHRASLLELTAKVRRLSPGRINHWANKTLEDPIWSRRASVHVGVRLLWLLVGIASAAPNDEEFALAFHHRVRRVGKNRKKAFLVLSDRAAKIIDAGHSVRELMRPRYLPMLVQPYPWQTKGDVPGGYVRIRTPFISKPTQSQKAALAAADLTKVYDGLNAVGATAWRINGRVEAEVRHLWEEGGGAIAVPTQLNAPKPPRPSLADTDEAVARAWKREAVEVYRLNIRLQADRGEFLHRLRVADRMRDRTAFYFPHQLDFRGRAYPIPPHLNHQGDDVCRGLLESGDEFEPGERGRWWLRVHAANCYGLDKAPFTARARWADDNSALITQAALRPAECEWWHAADKPWQFLAAAQALTYPDAGRRLFVQVDGTCNGLQHYAALGRDEQTAARVNLAPADAPESVYTEVARAAAMTVATHAAAGDPLAILLLDRVDRDMVKAPVMTSVYGVTMVGAREQVYARLQKIGVTGQDTLYDASRYLSNVVMEALGVACAGVARIMEWLRGCAEAITATGNIVRWTTPLGFPVVQPYRRWGTHEIRTCIQRVTLTVEDERRPVAVKKQCAGFAPNFIHSLDATHMFMVALACRAEGIPFAAVHDAYWAHAAHMDRLGVILRREFIALHSRPILADLLAELRRLNPDAELPEPPTPGTFDLRRVAVSPYFFS